MTDIAQSVSVMASINSSFSMTDEKRLTPSPSNTGDFWCQSDLVSTASEAPGVLVPIGRLLVALDYCVQY